MWKIFKSRKALSPVVAAIILIAVTVAVSIAVAAWMGALTFTFMGSAEQLNYTSSAWGASNAYFQFTVKNIGSSDLTLQDIRVDGNSVLAKTTYYTGTSWAAFGTGQPLVKGTSVSIRINGTSTGNFGSGVGYNFMVVTAKGNQFPYTSTSQ